MDLDNPHNSQQCLKVLENLWANWTPYWFEILGLSGIMGPTGRRANMAGGPISQYAWFGLYSATTPNIHLNAHLVNTKKVAANFNLH